MKKKSEQEHVRQFLHKRVTKRFLEVSLCSRAKQRQCKEMYKTSVLVVFSPFSLPSQLSITRFSDLFEQTINIIDSFAFSPG